MTSESHLSALRALYGRAQEGLYVDPKYNPVQMLQEKPSGYHRGKPTSLHGRFTPGAALRLFRLWPTLGWSDFPRAGGRA